MYKGPMTDKNLPTVFHGFPLLPSPAESSPDGPM
jgi:hypothetical protein